MPKDEKKAKHHLEIAAMGGYLDARYNLAVLEMEAAYAKQDGKLMRRALRHHMIAAKAGIEQSLDPVKSGFLMGHQTVSQ